MAASAAFPAIALLLVLHAIHLECVAEDAFIGFRVARNLADGHGLVWNVGEPPVEGYTNFLWVVLLALVIGSGLGVEVGSQLLGILASLVTLACTYRFGRRLLGWSPVHALVPCLMLSVSGPFATWAASGMETNAFGMLILIACYTAARYWHGDGSRRDPALCFAALLLAMLTRPEGVIAFAVIVAFTALLAIGRARATLRDFLGPVLGSASLFAVYFLWRWDYFGYPLPNTYYLKTGGTFHQYWRGGSYAAWFALLFLVPLSGVPAMLVWKRGRPRVPPGSPLHALAARARRHAGLGLCVALSLVYTLYIVLIGGDYMAMYRFFVPVLPLVYLVFGATARALLRCVSDVASERAVARGLLAVAAAGTFLHSTPLEVALFPKPARQHGSYRGVEKERWHAARLAAIGRFFREYKQSDDESLSVAAIGAVSYYSQLKIRGRLGNFEPRIAQQRTEGLGRGLPGHEKSDLAYVLSREPTYFVFTQALSGRPPGFPRFPGELDRGVREAYELRSVWLVDEENGEEGYFGFLERKGTRRDPGDAPGTAR